MHVLNMYSLFLALIAIVGSVQAQESMTLDRAIAIGLENNLGIKIDDKSILIAEKNDTWARAGKVPLVNVSLNLNNGLTNDNNPASFLQGTFYNGSLGLNADVQWLVYAGGRVKILKEQLSTNVQQQMVNKDLAIHNLLRTIYQQYYDVLFQQEQLSVLFNNMELSQGRLEYEQVRKNFGASNSYNLIQFENAIMTDSISLRNQENRVEVAKRNLYNTLGIAGMGNFEFPEELSILAEEIDATKLKDLLSEENYTLKSLQMIVSLQELNTSLEKSNRMPTISLNAGAGVSQNGFQFFEDNPQTGDPFEFLLSNRLNGSFGAIVSYNAYDGGVRRTNAQTAKISEEIARLDVLDATIELQNQLDILLVNYNNQRSVLALSDQQLSLAEQNLKMTEERFKAGLISSLDFRTVQAQFVSAAFSKVSAIYSLILTKAEIDYLVGVFE